MKKLTRRDFLKVSGAGLGSAGLMLLTGCGSSSSDSTSSTSSSSGSADTGSTESSESTEWTLNMYEGENAITDLVTYQTLTNEITDFVAHHSQAAVTHNVYCNLVSGYAAADPDGNLIPAAATSWESNEDATEWTFHLRNDVTWVDVNGDYMADMTSADFIAGLEWTLNFWKNESYNTSMPIETIAGAEEYYEYTKSLTEEEAEALAWNNDTFLETVGISTPDDYTVVYTMVGPKSYFYTLATYVCLYPIAPGLLESMTVDEYLAIDNTTMWYNGPYILTDFISGNEKVFEANKSWFGNDEHTRFQTVTVKMIDSTDVAFTLYQAGEIDHVTLNESIMANITEGSEYYDQMTETRYSKYSYQLYFCYDKNLEDGSTPDDNWNTAVANLAFRKVWYYGLDFTTYYARTNAVNPLKLENNCFTMKNLVSTSDGRDYTELVEDYLDLADYDGVNMRRLNPELAAQYKEEAIEELTAQGVTFPVEATYYVASSNQTALDTANVLKDAFSECFGDDFITLTIGTYISSSSDEVRTPSKASFYFTGWGADYGDPINYLGVEAFGSDDAVFATDMSKINNYSEEYCSGHSMTVKEPYDEQLIEDYQTFTDMMYAADEIVDDLDARYAAFAEAEAYMIDRVLVLPVNYVSNWQLTKINDYTKAYTMYGIIADYYYVDWETNSEGYTTEEYEALAAE